MAQATVQDTPTSDKKVKPAISDNVPSGAGVQKETESQFDRQKKLVAEIKEVDEEASTEAQKKILDAIGEVKAGEPKPEIPKDVAAAGVRSPDNEASEVLRAKNTIEFSFSEQTFEKGLKTKFTAAVVNNNVIGVSSIIALAMWVGRQIKKAHAKAMKVVFKKGRD